MQRSERKYECRVGDLGEKKTKTEEKRAEAEMKRPCCNFK